MTQRMYKIGEVSRLTGAPVRRLRFYADKGLLPPAERSAAGYRMFSDADLIRIELIAAMRSAGVSIAAIRDVLSGASSMTDILELRLAEIEAQIRRQRRTAAVLRSALRSPDPASADNLRRLTIMTELSAKDYADAMGAFIDEVANGGRVDDAWRRRMAHMTEVELPDQPTTAQIDAWIELQDLMAQPDFVRQARENARDTDAASLDAETFQEVQKRLLATARTALDAGAPPESPAGRAAAKDFLAGWAAAHGLEADAGYEERMRRKHSLHRHTMRRFWSLVFVIKGQTEPPAPDPAWTWLDEATTAYLDAR